jgi:hypothetical protein
LIPVSARPTVPYSSIAPVVGGRVPYSNTIVHDTAWTLRSVSREGWVYFEFDLCQLATKHLHGRSNHNRSRNYNFINNQNILNSGLPY